MPTLDEILSRNGAIPSNPPQPEGDDESSLPEPNAPYQAHSRTANKPVYSLHCMMGAEGIYSYQYVNLDSHSQFRAAEHGQIITLRFAGTKIWEVTITGTSLRKLYDGIHRHVIPWVQKSDRKFAAGSDNDPLIMDIKFQEIERD